MCRLRDVKAGRGMPSGVKQQVPPRDSIRDANSARRRIPATSWPLPQARLTDLPGSTDRRPGSPIWTWAAPTKRPRSG
jgi:hypothetical protein